MFKQIKISFIVPIYNVERIAKLFDDCIQSLRQQTYKNLEIILVDDGSTDDTPNRLQALQAQDDRIKVITHTHNKGAGGARNTGVESAQGDYIWFIDTDDCVSFSGCEIIADSAREHNYPDLIQFNYTVSNSPESLLDRQQRLTGANWNPQNIRVYPYRSWIKELLWESRKHFLWLYAVKAEVARVAQSPLFNPEDLSHSLEVHALSQSAILLDAKLYNYTRYHQSIFPTRHGELNFEGHVQAVHEIDTIISKYSLDKEFPRASHYFQSFWRLVTLAFFLKDPHYLGKQKLWQSIYGVAGFCLRDFLGVYIFKRDWRKMKQGFKGFIRSVVNLFKIITVLTLLELSPKLARRFFPLLKIDTYSTWRL